MTNRLNPKLRKAEILAAALVVAERNGYMQMQRADIAKQANVSPARVSQLFTTMNKLRRAVMRHAVQIECLPVIAQGIVGGNKHTHKVPLKIKKAAMAAML